jgi:hypothetical protein
VGRPLTRGMNLRERIRELSTPEPNTGCWLWLARVDRDGYPRMTVGGQQGQLAYRVSYEAFIGPIPPGLEPDHLCRVRSCVNFEHVEPVTHRVNVLRGVGLTAENARRTHCIHGHALAKLNVRVRAGRRDCLVCEKDRNQRRRAIPNG